MQAVLVRPMLAGLCLVMLASCSPDVGEPLTGLTLHATSAAYPWLSTAYDCAPPSAAIVLAESAEAELSLRLGEPKDLPTPAFEVGTDELLVVSHPQVGVGALTSLQVEAIFSGEFANWREVGGADLPIQVWAYAPGVDIQEAFDEAILRGRPVSSLARLAASAQHMSDAVASTAGSIGLLPRRWKAGNTREALSVATVPVLAIVKDAPGTELAQLLACMQARQ